MQFIFLQPILSLPVPSRHLVSASWKLLQDHPDAKVSFYSQPPNPQLLAIKVWTRNHSASSLLSQAWTSAITAGRWASLSHAAGNSVLKMSLSCHCHLPWTPTCSDGVSGVLGICPSHSQQGWENTLPVHFFLL